MTDPDPVDRQALVKAIIHLGRVSATGLVCILEHGQLVNLIDRFLPGLPSETVYTESQHGKAIGDLSRAEGQPTREHGDPRVPHNEAGS